MGIVLIKKKIIFKTYQRTKNNMLKVFYGNLLKISLKSYKDMKNHTNQSKNLNKLNTL